MCLSLFQNAQDYSIQYGDNVFGVTNALFTSPGLLMRGLVVVVGCLAQKKKKSLWGKKARPGPWDHLSQVRSSREAGRKQQGALLKWVIWIFGGRKRWKGGQAWWKGARKQQKVIDIFFLTAQY